jgi:tRNA U34 5-carboxymethylaminomethyl modifying GTPase MnmE/TrmE
MAEQILERLSQIEKIIAKYDSDIGGDARSLRQEDAVISSEALGKIMAEKEKEDRLLIIGIIGRVKAGKSSLLNALLFDGKPVLPEAATPMTAALTVLSYGEQFSATVEYFTRNDLAVIKKGHTSYKERHKILYEKKKQEKEERLKRRGETMDPAEIDREAKKKAGEELKDTPDGSCFDQYERMLNSGNNPEEMCARGTQTIDAGDEDALMAKMDEYVGSRGKSMPFTKSVEIRLPFDSLRDICIVDTPGINDPVRSREERTMEYLKQCDVVFIISPAGQFLSKEDSNVMDRVSVKEGVSEMFIVASQSDNELYDSEFKKAGGEFGQKEDSEGNVVRFVKNGANLELAQRSIQESLFHVVAGWLDGLKNSNPEVKQQFDQLVKDGKERVIITSGICSVMAAGFYKRETWTSGMNHVWKSLTQHYPDYFNEGESGKANLEKLGNIEAVRAKVNLARSMKKEIMIRKKEDYLNQQKTNIDNFLSEILKTAQEKYTALKDGDIQKTQAEKQSLEKKFSSGANDIDDVFDDCFEDFKQAALSTASRGVSSMIKNMETEVGGMESLETKIEEIEKGGIIAAVARFFGLGGYETKKWNVRTIRAGAVQSKISALVDKLQIKLEDSLEEARGKWKKDMPRRIAEIYGKIFEGDMSGDTDKLRRALRNVLNNMDIPPFDFGSLAFRSNRSGILKDDEVEKFLDSISEFLVELDTKYRQRTKEVLDTIEKKIKNERISALIFKDIEKQIDEFEKLLKSKTVVMERLEKCIAELGDVN